jgi:hypothetical protein
LPGCGSQIFGTRIVELRRHWLLRLISERQTQMAVANGVVSMHAARMRSA